MGYKMAKEINASKVMNIRVKVSNITYTLWDSKLEIIDQERVHSGIQLDENFNSISAALNDKLLRGDMITGIYKSMHGTENMDKDNFCSFSHTARPRGHPIKLLNNRVRTDKRRCCSTHLT